MIIVHRLNGTEFSINADLIETVEEKPDTTITLIGRRHFVVAERMDEVIEAVTGYRRKTAGAPIALPRSDSA